MDPRTHVEAFIADFAVISNETAALFDHREPLKPGGSAYDSTQQSLAQADSPDAGATALIAALGVLRDELAALRDSLQSAESAGAASDPFARWLAQVDLLEAAHAVPGALDEERGSFGTPPHFSPDFCRATDVVVEGSSAVVKVTRHKFSNSFLEFTVIDVAGDWRIADVVEFLDPPEAPLLAEEDRAERLGSGLELEWRGPLGPEDRPDLTRLFDSSEGTITDDEKATVPLEVREVGRFPIRGRILVGDWCYGVGVEAGMAGIFDAEGYFAVSTRAWTMAWRESAANLVESIVLADAAGPVGVASSSGWGDGTYGVYWGCDADGNPAQLVIDYGVLDH